MSLPVEIYSVDAVRAIDSAAINDAGIEGYTLMTRAAEASLRHACAVFPSARRWQIVCGAGNNAGDGYVLARLAAQQGIQVSVLAVVSPASLAGDAATAYADFVTADGVLVEWTGELDAAATLLVDALLGSGLTREVTGRFAELVTAINAHAAPVLALDIPAGVQGDTGEAMGVVVSADLTVTFVGLKAGLFLGDGPNQVGELRYASLDIPVECREKSAIRMRRISHTMLIERLASRPRNAHKGDFGRLLVIGGAPGMPGAIALCGEAALRCGAGSVSVATHPDHHCAIAAARPELMCHAVDTAADLDVLIQQASTLVIGPGLGQGDWGRQLFAAAMQSNVPLVVDADALNLLSASPVRRTDWILTPHPGEAARLLHSSSARVQQDRLRAIDELQDLYDGTVVLKGAGTLVSSAEGSPWLCTAGNPGMAAPGMGDVLAGVIAALLAQGLDRETAAAIGVQVHASAGDRAARAGERGLLASDLMPHLRQAVNPG